MTQLPYLSGDDLEALGITTPEIIHSIESTIQRAASGQVWAAPKAVLMPDDGRYMMAALAAGDGPDYLTVKTVVLNPKNSDQNLPQINGLVTMLNSQTGLPEAVLDGNWITAIRTAGLSAVAAKYMARSDATKIGFVGTGVQARSHLQLFSDMFPLAELFMFGRGQPNKDRLAAEGKARGLTINECATGQEVLEKSDLLITTVTHTGGAAPFLDAAGMPPGSFAAVVDLAAPWHRDSFGALDQVCVDDLEQERSLPNKLCNPDFISGDLSSLVRGDTPARADPAHRNAFVFRGHALGDLALSSLALDKYRALHPA